MRSLSTHVLDTSLGRPAAGVAVLLETVDGTQVGEGRTDSDGRLGSIGPGRVDPGSYRLRFDSGAYFASHGVTGFYPEVVVVFTVGDADEHYHVPVLLNPFGFSTYRGS